MKQTPSVISAGESTTDTLRREALTDAVADGRSARVAVVIPCFRVAEQIESVLRRIGPEVTAVYCVDDASPDHSSDIIGRVIRTDARVHLLTHACNQGVGAAVATGYRQALADGAEVIVKLDGDGQMDPSLIPRLIAPICAGEADSASGMPLTRLIGNAGLSLLTKLSSGYWQLFDPTNGFTAIHANVLNHVRLNKVAQRYFFESDLLFRLNTLQAVVADVPMQACYGDENSSLRISHCLLRFPFLHMRNFGKRIFYNYFLRGFSIASIELVAGLILVTFGVTFGTSQWLTSLATAQAASAGTVMLAALPVILGTQLLLSFLNFDIATVPHSPVHRRLDRQHPLDNQRRLRTHRHPR
jgi:dolichol-phosphate mannosyltransferase